MPRGRPRKGGASAQGVMGSAAGMDAGAVRQLESIHRGLLGERDRLDARIAAIAGALAALSGGMPAAVSAAAPSGRVMGRRPTIGRPRKDTPQVAGFREGSLKAYIFKVLSGSGGKPMAVKDITAGVIGSGFASENKTLGKSVGIALTQMPGVEKVGRGQFRVA